MAGEQQLQTKIMEWLKNHGFWAIKVVVSSKTGTPDILACSPKGRFIAIEVKYGANKPSALQSYNVAEVAKRGGIAFVTWDLQTVVYKLQGELNGTTAQEEKRGGTFLL